MNCNQTKMIGRDVPLEYAIGCGDRVPSENEWKRLGSVRTKGFTIDWDSTDATDDSSVGALREMLPTFQSLTVSADGTLRTGGGGAENATEIAWHIMDPVATDGKPYIWFRFTFHDITVTAYMMLSSYERSAPYDDVLTFSLEATATASEFGLIIEETPDPDAPDATSVGVLPASFNLTAGQSFNVQAVVLPVGASQNLRWTSSAPQIATVNLISGVVTAVAQGNATITATSETSGVTGTSTVTVQPVVAGVSVSPTATSLEVGDTEQITASVVPTGAAAGVTYTSLNPGIASVSSSGLVTALTQGTATIRVSSTARPGVSQVVTVTVTA